MNWNQRSKSTRKEQPFFYSLYPANYYPFIYINHKHTSSLKFLFFFFFLFLLYAYTVTERMPPRKDFKPSKDLQINDKISSTVPISVPSSSSMDILTDDEKIHLPVIDNANQSSVKKVKDFLFFPNFRLNVCVSVCE